MTGPNLLAWAEALEIKRVVDFNVYNLARAILADEEERKRQSKNAMNEARIGNLVSRIVSAEKHGDKQEVAELVKKALELGYVVTKTDGGYIWRAEPPSE